MNNVVLKLHVVLDLLEGPKPMYIKREAISCVAPSSMGNPDFANADIYGQGGQFIVAVVEDVETVRKLAFHGLNQPQKENNDV